MVRTRDSVGELEVRSSADEAARGPGFLDLTGRELGRYRIQKRLGRGGVTTVYQAYDIVDDIPVALKVLLHGNEEKLYNRFRQEAQTAAKLHHPHIVRTLRVGVTPGSDTAYIAMELVEGEDLAAMLAMRSRLTPEEACLLLHPIAHALAYAHAQGVVHRDVKPSNILLRTGIGQVSHRARANQTLRDDGPSNDSLISVILDTLDYPVVPLLGDFGIARALDLPELTSWGRTVGTPAFMAPEQARGQRGVDQRADIYALGAVFYRCVTGRPLFSGTTVQILHAHVYDSVVIREDIQRQLSQRHIQILQRSLAKDPADRYESAMAMAEDLRRGSDPTADLLTPAEREAGTTLTLELVSLETAQANGARHNVLVPADESGFTLSQQQTQTVASHATVHRNGTEPPQREQGTHDPNFDAELDQKLQRWSTLTLSILLTLLALVAFFWLLIQPLLNLNIRGLLLSPFATPVLLQPTGDAVVRAHISPSNGEQTARALSSASTAQRRLFIPMVPAVPPATWNSRNYMPNIDIDSAPTATSPPVVTSPAFTEISEQGNSPTALPGAHQRAISLPANSPPTVSPSATYTPVSLTSTTSLTVPPTPTISPASEQINGHCTSVTAGQFREYLNTLSTTVRESFRCATAQPVYSGGQYLVFERGYMLHIAALDMVFVSYNGLYNQVESPWESFDLSRLIRSVTVTRTPTAPEDLQFYPAGVFALVWHQDGVSDRLGMAITPEASAATLIAQKFNQGWLILREPSGAETHATLYVYPIIERFF